MTQADLYSEEHEPDPVTSDAVAAAMAATEPDTEKTHWWSKLGVALIIFLFVLASISGVATAINTAQNGHQNKQLNTQNSYLEAQNRCLGTLLESFRRDQDARVQVAKDDREVIDDLINGVFSVKGTQAQREAKVKAYKAAYNQRRLENEKRRDQLPPLFPTCQLTLPSAKPTKGNSTPLPSVSK